MCFFGVEVKLQATEKREWNSSWGDLINKNEWKLIYNNEKQRNFLSLFGIEAFRCIENIYWRYFFSSFLFSFFFIIILLFFCVVLLFLHVFFYVVSYSMCLFACHYGNFVSPKSPIYFVFPKIKTDINTTQHNPQSTHHTFIRNYIENYINVWYIHILFTIETRFQHVCD